MKKTCSLSENRNITVAQRGIQLIFFFANFLALGESFKATKIPLWVSCALKTLIRPKIKLKSLGFEPLTAVDSILLSKLAIFNYNFLKRP